IVSNTACKSVGALLIIPRTSLVALCCSVAESSSRSRDSSCSVTRCNSFLSWLSSVARGLFFFFEGPSRAMRVLLTTTLQDFQRLTVNRVLFECTWRESLVENEVHCQPRRKPSPPEQCRTRRSIQLASLRWWTLQLHIYQSTWLVA